MPTERAISGWVTMAAALISGGIAVGPPAAWYFFSYERIAGGIEAEAEISASLITQIIGADPDLWQFEHLRLNEYLARRPRSASAEIRRVVTLDGELVAESADPLPRPWIRRSQVLLDAGEPVGRVEIARSLQPIIMDAALLALLLILPAAALFHVLRTLPLEALRRTEGALRRERDAAQKYLDVAGVAFVLLDGEGSVRQVNRKGIELLGRPGAELLGRDWLGTFVDPGDRARVRAELAVARPGEVMALEYAVLRPAGDRRIVSWYATPLEAEGRGSGLLLSGVDLTLQRQLEEQLRQAQKLRAVGQLAGGVAHDFNNILAAIRSRAALLRADLAVGSPHRLDAEEILGAADRAAALTRSLLTFSRRQAMVTEPVELVELLRRSERRLQRLLRPEIAFAMHLPAGPLTVLADAVQIEQVLANLVTNARDAIRGNGQITLSASSATLDLQEVSRLGLGTAGPYARISVADTGVGIDAESRARLFEPFYTTKEQGKGTGLGLAIAFGIVELHRGALEVVSEPGRGTTVSVLLPLGTVAWDSDPDAAGLPTLPDPAGEA